MACRDGTTIFRKSGEDDEDVLSTLASTFSTSFASDGYAMTYDPVHDLLSLDQTLGPFELLVYQNTDPGLDLAVSFRLVPEPRALLLLLAGLPVVLLTRRRLASPDHS